MRVRRLFWFCGSNSPIAGRLATTVLEEDLEEEEYV